jgi:hypothetical protein
MDHIEKAIKDRCFSSHGSPTQARSIAAVTRFRRHVISYVIISATY